MSDRELEDLIDDLRAAIDEASSLSDDDRERLGALAARIDEATDEDEGLLDHLDDALGRFETEHAGLVEVINRIANALSAGGI